MMMAAYFGLHCNYFFLYHYVWFIAVSYKSRIFISIG